MQGMMPWGDCGGIVGGCSGRGRAESRSQPLRPAAGAVIRHESCQRWPGMSGTRKHTRFALQAASHTPKYPLDGWQGAAGLRDPLGTQRG